MQQLHELENRNKREEADEIRIKKALKIVKANVLGDNRKCNLDQSQEDKDKYCIKNFEEFDDIELCKKPEEFCFQCCNNEFGVMKLA